MRKYYTRPCNFYYGNFATNLIKKKKALPLASNFKIAFDKLEIFERKKNKIVKSNIHSIKDIKTFPKKKKLFIKSDLKNITSKRENICGIEFNKANIIGILNITPDSFSDGGLFLNKKKAYNQAKTMVSDGAVIIDVGGESTRPGSKIINYKKEWNRIKDTIIKLRKKFSNLPISLDTRKSYIMKKGLENGVNIINDVSGLNYDQESFKIIKSKNTPFILHHMQGIPDTMQKNPKYDDVLLDIYDFF